MAGVLQYLLRLRTADFDNPLRNAWDGLRRFLGSASSGTSTLSGLGAGFAGLGVVIGGVAATTAAALSNLRSYAEYDGIVRSLKTLEGTAEATRKRLDLLRDVAKLPGLDFEGAVKGDVRLRSAGLSAGLSERAIRSFGNAIATVGGGQEELQGITLALTQIASKGVVAAEEINQIAERVPQIRVAMKDAFGTANTEEIQKMGITSMAFIEGIVKALEKLPAVTAGARTAVENYDDSWKALTNTANEFSSGLSSSWLNTVSGVFVTARKDLERFKDLLGIETPGLQGPDGITEVQRERIKAREAEADAAKKRAQEEQKLAKENSEFWKGLAAERAESDAKNAADRVEDEKRAAVAIQAAREKSYAATLTEEANLQRQIANLRASVPQTAAAFNSLPANSEAQKKAAEGLAELATLEKELAELRKRSADSEEAAAKAAAAKAAEAQKELTAQQQATSFFNQENEILSARIAGNEKLATSLERQKKVEELKLQLMREQGLAESEAAAAAEKRVALEERAARPRRQGLFNEAESQQRRAERAGDSGDRTLGNTDRLALQDFERRQRNRPLTPAAAADALARGNGAADPGRNRRDERREQKANGNDPLLRVVKDISEKFGNIASA